MYSHVSKNYGCLTIIDNGEEYMQSEKYFNALKEYKKLEFFTNNNELSKIKSEIEPHYKCQCKCGKIHYYDIKTLESNPKYCYYPVSRWYKKNEDLLCVKLCNSSECLPSDEYCERYNNYKRKQIKKQKEKLDMEIAKIPRKFAENYDFDFTGKQYESLYIENCNNDHLESEPKKVFKKWNTITVYKEYKCKCILCEKEYYIKCSDFGIYPPTQYGTHAYYGYWSEAYCDCHEISSFQWIVNKLLFENNIKYQVEYSFDDLIGCYGKNKLRFDFVVFDENNLIKCLIECQGEQHYMPVEEFGGESQYQKQIKNDTLKRDYTKKHNIPLIEISYKNKKFEKVEAILKENGIIK